MRQQVLDVARRVPLHSKQHIREIRQSIDPMLLTGGDERVENSEVVARVLVAEEQVVHSTQRRAT